MRNRWPLPQRINTLKPLVIWLIVVTLIACFAQNNSIPTIQGDSDRPRVLITTDINIDQGDPDDRQSMAHLLIYANELRIAGIIAHRFEAGGVEATLAAIDAYSQDYTNPETQYQALGYPAPDYFKKILPRDRDTARNLLIQAAHQASPQDPLYVLVWGHMETLKDALLADPAIAPQLRVISIGTHFRTPYSNECNAPNWNASGRNDIYNDPRFTHLWWVEIDWTFEAMFMGEEPQQLLEQIREYGALGHHIWDVVQPVEWAHYFRAGDTPALLYLLDPDHPADDPTQGSWAGQFYQPFPETRPHYYTDVHGTVPWDYENPCNTWEHVEAVYQARVQTLLDQRPEMYAAFLEKLQQLYGDIPER